MFSLFKIDSGAIGGITARTIPAADRAARYFWAAHVHFVPYLRQNTFCRDGSTKHEKALSRVVFPQNDAEKVKRPPHRRRSVA
jgi:hypothetical protein